MEEKVKKIIFSIMEEMGEDTANLIFSKETRLREDLNFDSFNLAELTVYIEDEFDIDIFEDGVINTIGKVFEKLKNS